MLTNQPGGNAGVGSRARRMLYSRGQIALAVFLAGPLPPLHMLISNLRAMRQTQLLPSLVAGGYALMTLEFVVMWFIPGHSLAALLLPAINAALATCMMLGFQPEKSVILASGDYLPAPAWRVAWTCIIRLLEFIAWFIAVAVVFHVLGIEMTK